MSKLLKGYSNRSPNDQHELFNLSLGLLQAYADSERRMLGSPMSRNSAVNSIVNSEPNNYGVNSHTDAVYMIDRWDHICNNLDKTMRRKAQSHWTKQWLNESNQLTLPSKSKYLTDAQRHAMRRRNLGSQTTRIRCRCMSYDHLYVNDEKCRLYSNLKALYSEYTADSAVDVKKSDQDQKPALKHPTNENDVAIKIHRIREMAKHSSRDLNTMEKACCDRLARNLTEKDNVTAEQKFIEQMEEVQRTNTNQSLSAPSLTAMVLSAVSELECEYGNHMSNLRVMKPPTPEVEVLVEMSTVSKIETVDKIPSNMESNKEVDDDEDDDDVPLMALCKRRSEDNVDPSLNKKQKCDPTKHNLIHPWYLAKLVQHISTRWGHVFQEPSDEDYIW